MPDEDELIPAEESLPMPSVQRFNLIYDLIQQVTSIGVVSKFLKFKHLHHSAGSWGELRDKRLLPALRAGKFTLDDLSNFLNECEEYGRNHTFLYQISATSASVLMAPARLEATCAQLGRPQALSGVEVENMPDEPTLTQVRQEDDDGHRSVTFKIIQTRRESKFLGETIESGDILVRRWTHQNVRAVNVARLHASGLLEVRVRSHQSSTKYDNDLRVIWFMLKDFLPPAQFKPFALGKAKKNLWERRVSLEKKLRFADSTLCNTRGNKLIATSGPATADLFDDDSMANSVSAFLGGQGAHCESSNIWWKPVDGLLDREIHMLLSGLNNEFAVTTDSTKGEYEYVFNELRVHSK